MFIVSIRAAASHALSTFPQQDFQIVLRLRGRRVEGESVAQRRAKVGPGSADVVKDGFSRPDARRQPPWPMLASAAGSVYHLTFLRLAGRT